MREARAIMVHKPVSSPPMEIALIAAMAANRVIGRDNQLPWHLPEDLQHFKRLTLGHHLIMGRKTFDSIGRPLPGRTTIIVTRQLDYVPPAGCLVAHSLENALALCAELPQVFVVGGAEVYRQALPLAHTLYLTEVDVVVEGDAFFPEFTTADWQETAREAHQNSTISYAFLTYSRNS